MKRAPSPSAAIAIAPKSNYLCQLGTPFYGAYDLRNWLPTRPVAIHRLRSHSPPTNSVSRLLLSFFSLPAYFVCCRLLLLLLLLFLHTHIIHNFLWFIKRERGTFFWYIIFLITSNMRPVYRRPWLTSFPDIKAWVWVHLWGQLVSNSDLLKIVTESGNEFYWAHHFITL